MIPQIPMHDANGDLNTLFLLASWFAAVVSINLAMAILFRSRKDQELRNLSRGNLRVWVALITIPGPLVALMLVCFAPLIIVGLLLPRVVLGVVGFFEQALGAKPDDKLAMR
jgi:hypothetical protein